MSSSPAEEKQVIMFDRSWLRLGAACGVLSVILALVGVGLTAASGGFIAPIGGSTGEIARAFENPAPTGVWVGAYLSLLAFLLFIAFAARLWVTLRRAEGDPGWLSATAFGSALVFAATTLIALVIGDVAKYRAGSGMDAQVVTALFDLNIALYILSWAISAVFLGAAAIVILRTRAFSRLFGWSAAALAVASLAAVAAPTSGGVEIPALLFLLWVLAISVALIRRVKEEPTTEGARSTARGGRPNAEARTGA